MIIKHKSYTNENIHGYSLKSAVAELLWEKNINLFQIIF